MADRVTYAVDTAALVTSLGRLGSAAERLLAAEAKSTAHAIRGASADAFARQTRGTGQTAQNLTVAEDRTFQGGTAGYLVYARAIRRPANMPVWFEFGTARMMARPFLLAAARSEHAGYLSRIQAAVDRASTEAGF